MSFNGIESIGAKIGSINSHIRQIENFSGNKISTTGTATSVKETDGQAFSNILSQQSLGLTSNNRAETSNDLMASSLLAGQTSNLGNPLLGQAGTSVTSFGQNNQAQALLSLLANALAPQQNSYGNNVNASGGLTVGDELAQRIAATPVGTHPDTPSKRPTKIPPELAAYGNGEIPESALKSVGVGEYKLWGPAADSFKAMRAAARRDGVNIGVNSCYRNCIHQQQLVDKLGLYSQGGKAAPPGRSNHGWGLSMDLKLDDDAQKWMRANAKKYGFVEDVPREPWHWTFLGDPDEVADNIRKMS